MPSMARIDPKKRACEMGALPRALPRWLAFAPNDAQIRKSAGSAAATKAENTRLMILGGDCGSSRKMWWISLSAAWRVGFAGRASGTLGSRVTWRSKALAL
jgi:hypothetical protein